MTDPFVYETYAGREGEHFLIVDAGETLDLALHSVGRHGADGAGGARGFVLHFTGPPSPILPQRIYRIEHADLGPLEDLIVPVAGDADRTTYEAVFN